MYRIDYISTGDVYADHQHIKRIFNDCNCLYRLKENHTLVITDGAPNNSSCSVQTTTIPEDRVPFSLLANVAKRSRSSKKRIPITDPVEALGWLNRKEEEGGFKTDSVSIDFRGIAKGRKKNHYMTFNSILYKGYLEVIDKKLFQEVLIKGLGFAKAFGFGLLLCKNESI